MKIVLLAMCLSLSSMICVAQNREAAARAKTDEANDEQLLKCVENSDEDCVMHVLATGADANATNEEGVAVLSLAAEGKSASIVRLLLSAGADVNAAQQGEATPLCRAARFGREKTVELLLDEGAKINAICDADHGDTPLMESLQRAWLSGMPDDWKDEFAGTGDDDGGDKNNDKNAAGEASNETDKLRGLLNAPGDSFLAIARRLLARGADANVVANCEMGETALMYAAMSADLEMVKELLSHGADVNKGVPVLAMLRQFENEYEKAKRLALPARSKEQSAMLAWNEKTKAAQGEIKELLKAAGAKETVDDEEESAESDTEALEAAAREAFSSTVKKDDVEDLERLIKAYIGTPLGAQVLPEALRLAVVYDCKESFKLLLARGVDPNGGKYKVLLQAASGGKLEYVLMLLEAGADVHGTDDEGRTALDFAESWGDSREEQRAIIEALKAHGAKSKKQK